MNIDLLKAVVKLKGPKTTPLIGNFLLIFNMVVPK